jgi:hypothetical protein
MVAASLIGMYFRSEVVAYVTLYAGQQDTLGIGTVGSQNTQIPRLDSQKANSMARDSALQQQAEAGRASSQTGWWDPAQVKQAAEATAPEAGQPLEKELGRREALANELARTGRDIDGRNLQQEGPAKTAQALQQEREKTSALVQEVAAVRDELRASAVQHRRDLAQQRDRGDTLASALARAQRDLETQAALSSKAGEEAAQAKQAAESATAELRQSLQKEHERAEALTGELARAQRDLETQVALSSKAGEEAQVKQAAESATAELRQSLQKEHDRAEALVGELAKAQRNLETQVALSSKAGEEAAQVKQAAESATAELRRSLQTERDRAEALSSELARAHARTAGEAAQVKQAAESATAELQQSLQKEHDRAEALASELASARRDIETRVAQSRKTDDGTSRVKQTAENAMAELRQSSQKEHDNGNALAQVRESTRRTIGARVAATNSQINQVKPAAEAAATEQPAAAEAQGSPEAARLLARASALLGQGNIGAARVVLERAAETGSAQAIFMLAETYDPLVLSTWRTFGTRGDATKARELYAKAHAGGIQEAKDRFDALR